jgi:hypothetical protein
LLSLFRKQRLEQIGFFIFSSRASLLLHSIQNGLLLMLFGVGDGVKKGLVVVAKKLSFFAINRRVNSSLVIVCFKRSSNIAFFSYET